MLSDIQKLEKLLLGAKIVKKIHNPTYIRSGMRVEYEESGAVHSVMLVDPLEADPLKGFISFKSPIGYALLDRRRNEIIDVVTPNGSKRLHIKQLH